MNLRELKEDIEKRRFRYCPMCRTEMELITQQDGDRPVCPSCGYTHYLNPAPACGAVVFRKGRLLLVQRAHDPYVGKWTIPAGFMEWGESPEETSVRELKEETNLNISLGGLFHVYSGSDDPRTRAILILYFGEVIGGELKAGDDASEAEWFALDEIPADDQIAFESHRRAIAKLKLEFPDKFRP